MNLIFYSYRPLSLRDPSLAKAVKDRGGSPDATLKRDEEIKKLPLIGGRPFIVPEWKRDPYERPKDDQ